MITCIIYSLQAVSQNPSANRLMIIKTDKLDVNGNTVSLDSVIINGKKVLLIKASSYVYQTEDEILNSDSLEVRAFTSNRIYDFSLIWSLEPDCGTRRVSFFKYQKQSKVFVNVAQCSSAQSISTISVYDRATHKLIAKESSDFPIRQSAMSKKLKG